MSAVGPPEAVGRFLGGIDTDSSMALRSYRVKTRGFYVATKKPRRIPLTRDIKAALHDLAKVRRQDTNQVFLYDGKPVKGIKRAFKTALKETGIRDFRFLGTVPPQTLEG